jgi:hypothetical protein
MHQEVVINIRDPRRRPDISSRGCTAWTQAIDCTSGSVAIQDVTSKSNPINDGSTLAFPVPSRALEFEAAKTTKDAMGRAAMTSRPSANY